MKIHPSAVVHPKARLADDVEVQPFSIIDEHVTIGAGTIVGPHCVVTGKTVLGENNRLFSGAQVGVLPQDLKHVDGEEGILTMGNGNVVREFVTISSSTVYHGEQGDVEKVTQVGDNCLFMACTHVAHDCVVGNGVIMANSAALAGHVTVQDGAILGGLTGVHQFVTVGRLSFVGAMARLSKDVLPYMIVEGHTPAKCYGPNRLGLERNGLSPEAIQRVRALYRVLYRSGLNTTQALAQIEATMEDSEERMVILEFIRGSQRGVT
jgi:UDP-N-acetylglucosamine acyltransferase